MPSVSWSLLNRCDERRFIVYVGIGESIMSGSKIVSKRKVKRYRKVMFKVTGRSLRGFIQELERL